MEKIIKCSQKEHEEFEAINYCQICNIYMCNKCEKIHNKLCSHHSTYDLKKDLKEIFTGICFEDNHPNELKYFCRTHNKLCCAACISKIKDKGDGQHYDCDICSIENIKDEKKKNLNENILKLRDLLNSFDKSIDELKIIFEKVSKNKELLKDKIQKIFSRIRNALNDREDNLLLEVDKQFGNLYFWEELIKESEKIPNRIKLSLDKNENIEELWNDNNKLSFVINECINIENNVKDINKINYYIIKSKNNFDTLKCNLEEDEITQIIDTINKFGKIYFKKFQFKKCPNDINENRKYILTGKNDNIITKTGPQTWMGTICRDALEKSKVHRWKIKILKTHSNRQIMVGVAPIDFNIYTSSYDTCGWYYDIRNELCSGPPHNYSDKKANLGEAKNEVIVVMNMIKGSLKFIINNQDKGNSYTNIPLDKPIAPAVLMKNTNDSLEICQCDDIIK